MPVTQNRWGSPEVLHGCSSKVFVNSAYEACAEENGVAAELQAARLRMEATERKRAALASELATTQTRLQDALEVLEGVLGERSALRRQAQELQAQLAASLAAERTSPAASPARATPAQPRSPAKQQLQCELVLARAQLRELASAREAWEAERVQLVQEVEEERQRLQQGLAEALGQASAAQRDADAASERAAHWCSLAQALQRTALLSEGSASPASTTSTVSCYSPARGTAAEPGRGLHASACFSDGSSGAGSLPWLLAEVPTPEASYNATGSQLGGPGSPAGGDAHEAVPGHGPGLITAFQAVATKPADDPGSPELQHCALSAAYNRGAHAALAGGVVAARDKPASGATPASSPAASAELVPGTHLQLLHKLPNPGLSCASSLSVGGGRTPPTPEPFGLAAGSTGAALETPDAGKPGSLSSSNASTTAQASPSPPASVRTPSLLSRLLLRGACAAWLPPAQGDIRRMHSGQEA